MGKAETTACRACLLQQTELDVPQWVKAVDETVAADPLCKNAFGEGCFSSANENFYQEGD